MLMVVVMVSGLVISLLALLFVSQQQRVREINLKNDLGERLRRIGADIENRTRGLMEDTLKRAAANLAFFDDADKRLQGIKNLVLNHPIVQYPFLIRRQGNGEFLFPLSRRTAPPLTQIPDRAAVQPQIRDTYLKGRDLELKERKFTTAIGYYLQALGQTRDTAVQPYIYRAIGGAYFKMNRFPQALWYYRAVIRRFPHLNRQAKGLYFLVLRQTALSYKLLGQQEAALRHYLQLYEAIVADRGQPNSRRFEFLQNEALDYLNRYARAGAVENRRFPQAAALDISLNWLYFDLEEADMNRTPRETRQASTVIRLRDLYAADDEKTQFYRDLKRSRWWAPAAAPPKDIVRLKTAAGGESPPIGIRAIDDDVFFGFTPDLSYIRSHILPDMVPQHLNDPALQVRLQDKGEDRPGNDRQYPYKLLSLPLGKLFPGKNLVLYAQREDLIPLYVKREMRLNYGLVAVLILTLIAGILLFYKYIAREAELVRLKANFVDNVSHTLKTPLTRMGLLAENVEQGWVKDDGQRREFFHTILAETARLNDMIDNMLDFSRIEAGKKQYELREASLQEIVRAFVDQYSAHIKQSGFTLDVRIAPDLPRLRLDREAIKLVLVNLVQNALKYSGPEKYIGITVEGRGQSVVIEIRDKGIGIAEGQRQRIFEKFGRADDPRVQASEGSGLGLFLVRHAVRAHGGSIDVQSRLAEGTTFSIYLPINGGEG